MTHGSGVTTAYLNMAMGLAAPMASPITRTITVPLALDGEGLLRQLEVLRTLVSQIGFALDTAILALRELEHSDGGNA